MSDRKDFLREQAAKLEEARKVELVRRLHLIAKFVPYTWISLRHTSIASLLTEQPKIVIAVPNNGKVQP